MTREEAEAWVAPLKPGDVVIQENSEKQLCKMIVTKVTPSGIVRTRESLSFKVPSWSNYVRERGNGYSYIVPATKELLEEVERQERDRAEEIKRNRKIREAAYKMSSANAGNISYDFAIEFLELCDKHNIKL